MIDSTLVKRIAKVCHDVNRAYCQSIGDDSQMPWDEAPAWQRASAIQGVTATLEAKAAGNPLTPEMLHDTWTLAKLEDGWQYGPVKDADAKTHPCLVSYGELPPEQRAKDLLFQAVVNAMS